MSEQTTIVGLVATTPRVVLAGYGVEETTLSFRLVSQGGPGQDMLHADGSESRCNWYTIKCRGRLADNVHLSIDKGNRIIVTGGIEVHEWDNGEKTGTSVEIVATAIGYDLNYGTTVNTKVSIDYPLVEERA